MKKSAEQLADSILKKIAKTSLRGVSDSSVKTTDPKGIQTFARPKQYYTEGSSMYTTRITPDPTPSVPNGQELDIEQW